MQCKEGSKGLRKIKMERPAVNIVVPLYNEEEVFESLIQRLQQVLDRFEPTASVILVNDGSRDHTPQLMEAIAMADQRFSGVFLSRNFGHQYALTAGLSCVDATEAVFVIDGDLQDPPEMIHEFYQYLQEGYDVVYASRSSDKERYLKRTTSALIYRFFNKVTQLDMPLDAGDCCMMSTQVVHIINDMPEHPRFVRAMRTWVGFKQKEVYFERPTREHGETKYTYRKLLQMALDGIFGFSKLPIQLVGILGTLATLISVLYFLVALFNYSVYGTGIEGFTGLLFVIVLFGGIQLFSIAIIGQYILHIFFQVKQRPSYIIKKQIKNGKTIL